MSLWVCSIQCEVNILRHTCLATELPWNDKNTQLLLTFIFCPRIHPVLSYLPSYPSPPRAINLAQFADLSRRNQEGANSSDPIRRHSSEREEGKRGRRRAIYRGTDGRAASEFNYLQINQRLLECRQISQVSLAVEAAGGGGETSKPDRTRYFPKRNDWKEEASRSAPFIA